MNPTAILDALRQEGNFRSLPGDSLNSDLTDFSTNDYLGLATRHDLRKNFLETDDAQRALFTSSASRLLAATQDYYYRLEQSIANLYGREALMFNSGYHANSGLIKAITDKNTLIIADKLVHASIIDGIMLSRCKWTRFRHNDINHLEKILSTTGTTGENTLIIVESVYSMDGDSAPIEDLVALKERYPALTLYIDEAHAVGVTGNRGCGLAASCSNPAAWDIIVGTLGKALASMGAFAVMSPELKDLAINRCRSLIFSTALPPINVLWSTFMLETMATMHAERDHLHQLSRHLADGLTKITGTPHTASHIQPFTVGAPHRVVELSRLIAEDRLKVLPIRTPTVPPGTERLRISLSAAMTHNQIDKLITSLSELSSR